MNYIVEKDQNFNKIENYLVPLDYIRELHKAGFVILPTRVDKKKQRYKWRKDEAGNFIRDENGHYKGMPLEDLEHIYSTELYGISILCGKDGLECLDIEMEYIFEDLKKSGIIPEEIFKTLTIVKSPSGGYHVLYKCPAVKKKEDLAFDENGDILIETRAWGCYFVIPSIAHPTRQFIQGDMGTIPVISAELREEILEWCREQNKCDFEKVEPSEVEEYGDDPVEHTDAIAAIETPLPVRIAQAKAYLESVPGTIQGHGADRAVCSLTLRILKGFALPVATAQELLEAWGARADQLDNAGGYYPWDESQIKRKLEWALEKKYRGKIGDKLTRILPDLNDIIPEYIPEIKVPENKLSENKPKIQKAFFNLSEIQSMESPVYLVKNHINLNTITVIYGPSGSYKSFYAIKLALAVASGTPFLERYKTKKKPVAYVYSEGTEGAKLRFLSAVKDSGITVDNDHVSIFPSSYQFSKEEEVKRFVSHWQGLKEKPSVIIIDTLNRNYGGDENSTKDMTGFVANIDKLRRLTGAAILIIHHTGKDDSKGARGSSVLRAAADTEIKVDLQGSYVGITCTKQKDIAPFQSYALSVRIVNSDFKDEDGDILTTCVLDWKGDLSEIKNTAQEKKTENKCKERFINVGSFMNTEDWVTIKELEADCKQKYDYIYDTLNEAKKLGWVDCEKGIGKKPSLYKLTDIGVAQCLAS